MARFERRTSHVPNIRFNHELININIKILSQGITNILVTKFSLKQLFVYIRIWFGFYRQPATSNGKKNLKNRGTNVGTFKISN